MIIFKENQKTRNIKESVHGEMTIQQFCRLVGRRSLCHANWASKSEYTKLFADIPAFCGIDNNNFYIGVSKGLYVIFPLRSISKVYSEVHEDGAPTDYAVALRDGTIIRLNLL
jgi:hypothetical protein